MQLNGLDWLIVVASLLVTFAPVLFFARRAGRGTTEFFASGRAAPWWLIGTSMVATTFSTDTPNLVTNMVRTKGVADNWEWWAFLLTGMMTVFFYARLWRRSRVLTDLEFYELRYSGASAAFLRGFRALYLGLFFNCVIMASVTLAAAKIANVMLGWERWQAVLVCVPICIVFGSIAGLWGALATDLLQFALAMFGVFGAAYYSLQLPQVGGLSGLVSKLPAEKLNLLPDFGNWDLALGIFIIPLAVQWWSVWYPGAEPGGGSYIAQRMLAARSERDALAGTLWFNVAHYALRPWPWIVVALCSMLVFPTLDDLKAVLPHVSEKLIGDDMAYPAMLTLLPHGLLGLLVASLLAAYVSTMTTHMNWGTSYLVVDFYRRFILRDSRQSEDAGGREAGGRDPHPGPLPGRERGAESAAARERQLVLVSRVVSAALMILSGALMFALTTAKDAFDLMLSIGAGTGLLYLLRWFWWRINAWSELAAMAASFAAAVFLLIARKLGVPISGHWGLVGSVAFTTVVWVVVTYLTPPVERETLLRFYRLVRPAGPGWREFRAASGVAAAPDRLSLALLGWFLGCVLVYSALFGTGSFIYGRSTAGVVGVVAFVASGGGLLWLLRTLWRSSPGAEQT
ncbi:MAG TPA: Na+:solute symporter [Phycisphaerae bacterium]|nr:Na+:solute symporter [Phycisphaerae bacterium]HNU45398.1 Na+:solute symporter [Phycisphaerae bacterium]